MDDEQLGVAARAIVRRVVDGDTVDIELRVPMRIRTRSHSSPELSTSEGVAAKEELKQILPRGCKVRVFVQTTDARSVSDVFTFGRVLGDIWKTVRGRGRRNVSDEMIERGHATPPAKKYR